jgi:uncharacterized protein
MSPSKLHLRAPVGAGPTGIGAVQECPVVHERPAPLQPASAIYEGWIRHRRLTPVQHAFRVPLFMSYLDLDELPQLFDHSRLWSARGPAPSWFRRADYLGDPAQPLREAVLDSVQEQAGVRPNGPVRLLTTLRTFGCLSNPVSFYYCFDSAGEHVEAVAAEVTNTPWGERHVYAVARGEQAGRVLRAEIDKDFHVSPFLGMDAAYEWRLSEPGSELQVHIENRAPDGTLRFDATLALERREPTPSRLRRALIRYPLQPLRVVGGIYAHALRLKLKGAPYHAHPQRPKRGEAGS